MGLVRMQASHHSTSSQAYYTIMMHRYEIEFCRENFILDYKFHLRNQMTKGSIITTAIDI
jgi:hypothetical protein